MTEQAPEATGTQNLKAVLHLAITIVTTIEKAKEDGKIDAADAGLIFNLIPAIGPGVSGLGAFPKEVKDLSVAEITDLSAFIVSELGMTEGKAPAIIQKSLSLVAASVELIAEIKA